MRDMTFLSRRLALSAVLFFALAATCTAQTKLEVRIAPSGGLEFPAQWSTVMKVGSQQYLTFHWLSTEVGPNGQKPAAATWRVFKTNATFWPTQIASGTLTTAPPQGQWADFNASFFTGPAPAQAAPADTYLVDITAFDAQGHPLGLSSNVVKITYGQVAAFVPHWAIVPSVVGLPYGKAVIAIKAAGLTSTYKGTLNKYHTNMVKSQNPSSTLLVNSGDVVHLVI